MCYVITILEILRKSEIFLRFGSYTMTISVFVMLSSIDDFHHCISVVYVFVLYVTQYCQYSYNISSFGYRICLV